MTKTIALYDEDAYATAFDAQVVDVREVSGEEALRLRKLWGDSDGQKAGGHQGAYYAVVLDRTLFFPEQGGQKADVGVLRVGDGENDDAADGEADTGCFEVFDVQIEDGVITHFCHSERAERERGILPGTIAPGTMVHGEVSWQRRFDFMQHHSGEHILSGTAHRLYGCDNTGFHLTENEMTLDFSKLLSKEEIAHLERTANEAVWKDLPIEVSYPSEEEAASLDYRSKKEITDRLRIVTIEGVDVCACCAPHVHRTGEIGLIKVVKVMKNKGGTRLKVVCGQRAYDYLTAEHEVLHEASDMLSTSAENVPDRIRRFKEEIYTLKGEIKSLKKQ